MKEEDTGKRLFRSMKPKRDGDTELARCVQVQNW